MKNKIALTVLCLFAFLQLQAEAKERPNAIMLYYSSHCPYSREVLNYLDKNNETIPMKNVANNSEAKEELIRLGGKAIVPCLIVEGQAIYHDQAIIDWLMAHSDRTTKVSKSK